MGRGLHHSGLPRSSRFPGLPAMLSPAVPSRAEPGRWRCGCHPRRVPSAPARVRMCSRRGVSHSWLCPCLGGWLGVSPRLSGLGGDPSWVQGGCSGFLSGVGGDEEGKKGC